jgi:hypothetical protein
VEKIVLKKIILLAACNMQVCTMAAAKSDDKENSEE